MKFWLLDHVVILSNTKDLNEINYCNFLKHIQKKKAVLDATLEGARQQWVLARGEGLRSPGIGSRWSTVYEREEKRNAAMQKVGDRISSWDTKVEKAHQRYYHSTEDKNIIAEIVMLMNLA